MEIKYLGHSSFFIKTKTARIVVDPFDPKRVGLKFTKLDADIVTISHHHPDHDNSAAVGGNPLVIDWPGEYEKQAVRVFGFQSFHDKSKGAERGENILYKFEAEDLSVLHCGDLGLVPSDDFIDQLGEIHVMMVPVGGKFALDATEAVQLIKKVDPFIVIPMHYNTPQHNQEVYNFLAPVEDFLQKMGAEGITPTDKLVVKKEDFTDEQTRVVVMKETA